MNYNVSTVISELGSLVGFKSSDGFSLGATLTGTTLKMNSYHPLLQLDTLDNVRPEGQTLEEFLVNVRESSISTVLSELMAKKIGANTIKTKLSDTIVFDSTARFSNITNKSSRFVGWTFRPANSTGLVHTLDKVAFQFLEPVSNLTLYVFHSSQKDAVTTRTITTTKTLSVEWVTLDQPITLDYTSYDRGGYYMIGYFEDDLTVSNHSIYKEHNLSIAPCYSCNYNNVKYYKDWSKYVKISTVWVDGDDMVSEQMPSNELVNFENRYNYGLNFNIQTNCDITEFITKNKLMIANALQVRYAIDLVRYIEMGALRSNKVTDGMAEASFIAINGSVSENNHIKVRGFIHDYADQIDSLNFDMSNLDPICIASSRVGIKYK